jgi:hypothetical protein
VITRRGRAELTLQRRVAYFETAMHVASLAARPLGIPVSAYAATAIQEVALVPVAAAEARNRRAASSAASRLWTPSLRIAR